MEEIKSKIFIGEEYLIPFKENDNLLLHIDEIIEPPKRIHYLLLVEERENPIPNKPTITPKEYLDYIDSL